MSCKDWLDEHIGRKWRKRLDQILHFLWAFIALLPIVIAGPVWWAGGLSGFLIDLPRELVDQWPIDDWFDTILDISFFTIGGICVCLIF